MSALAENVKHAAAYELAKFAHLRIPIDSTEVDTLAALVSAAVLEELASREEECREVSPKGETTTSRDECAVRAMEYTEAAKALRVEAS